MQENRLNPVGEHWKMSGKESKSHTDIMSLRSDLVLCAPSDKHSFPNDCLVPVSVYFKI